MILVKDNLECSQYVFNNFNDHLNAHVLHDPCPDQYFVEQNVVLNHVGIEDRPCNEEMIVERKICSS